ncbi:MAG: thiamine pyrophosphate-dependent dehydrogenase E1 component subunit alpha [Gemmatimonadetes bacterium]|nr:thiamine pyrophosphate-dependent dehydrogenase E1 component subunit alpha [Gemmatimonadota bacterium]
MATRAVDVGELREPAELPERGTLLAFLYYMKLQRAIEDRIITLYRQGKIVGGVFTGRGQEAIGVGSAVLAGAADVIFPSHRDLGAFLVKGMKPQTVFAQYLGRVGGPTRGRDANLHMGEWSLGIGAFISHMADTVPVAAGVALSFKLRRKANVVLCYHGDGATSRGDWHEGLNLAAVLGLPVVYLCVNNRYAYSTPLSRQMAVAGVAERAGGYGMPVESVDGNDVLAVWASARRAVERARAGDGPSFIECWTYRMSGHSAHDDARYVAPEFFEEGRRWDPIARYTLWLREREILADGELAALDERVASEVEAAVAAGEASPYPEGSDAGTGVYAE